MVFIAYVHDSSHQSIHDFMLNQKVVQQHYFCTNTQWVPHRKAGQSWFCDGCTCVSRYLHVIAQLHMRSKPTGDIRWCCSFGLVFLQEIL
jgi:hypothetical protein